MQKTIKRIMDKEHDKIDSFLMEFEESLNSDIKKIKETFSRFNWNLEKHFFLEEKVIFTLYLVDKQDSQDIEELLKEHKEILLRLKKIKENLDSGAKPIFSDLKQTLVNHRKFEDEVFYPRLDEELSERDKQLIFERTDEVITD